MMAPRRRWLIVVVCVVAVATGAWLLTRPPTMFIVGLAVLDRDHALVLTRRNEDARTRYWAVKVHATEGVVWTTELSAQGETALQHVHAVRAGGVIALLLERPLGGGDGERPGVVGLDEASGERRWEIPLPAMFRPDIAAPAVVGRYAVFRGCVSDAEGTTCGGRWLVVDPVAGELAFSVCRPDAAGPCELRFAGVGYEPVLSSFGGRLLVEGLFSLALIDLEERAVVHDLSARGSCRDGEDLLILRKSDVMRLTAGGELAPTPPTHGWPEAPREPWGCGRAGDARTWWWPSVGDSVLTVAATDADSGEMRWRVTMPDLSIRLGELRQLVAGSSEARYLPIVTSTAGEGPEGTRWLDVVAGRVGDPVWASFPRSGTPVWASPSRVVTSHVSRVSVFDVAEGRLLDTFAASDVGPQAVSDGRLWLHGRWEWATADALPWAVLDVATLEVIGRGGEWTPVSRRAALEADLGPFPDAQAALGAE